MGIFWCRGYKMFCNQIVETIAQPCEYTKNTELYNFKMRILWYKNCISIKK